VSLNGLRVSLQGLRMSLKCLRVSLYGHMKIYQFIATGRASNMATLGFFKTILFFTPKIFFI
jgi:hypothetical protein